MSEQQKQLYLTAFMRPVSLHSGAWRYPGAYPDANFNLKHLKSFIQKLEEAKYHAFFMAGKFEDWLSVVCILLILF